MKGERIPASEVLAWLESNHPDLHALAELDRQWVWISGDTLKPCSRGCACDACQIKAITRKALCEFGFRFAKHGHPLPSGRVGTWSHSCVAPKPFTKSRRSFQKTNNNHHEPDIDNDPAMIAAREFLGV